VSVVRHAIAVLAACTTLVLTGCGQKGPLTLPDKTAAVVTPPAGAPVDKAKAKSTNPQPPQ
jgi:predicted small lipoprotein YifL